MLAQTRMSEFSRDLKKIHVSIQIIHFVFRRLELKNIILNASFFGGYD